MTEGQVSHGQGVGQERGAGWPGQSAEWAEPAESPGQLGCGPVESAAAGSRCSGRLEGLDGPGVLNFSPVGCRAPACDLNLLILAPLTLGHCPYPLLSQAVPLLSGEPRVHFASGFMY